LDIDGKPVTIRSQIQLYATNDQLSCEYGDVFLQCVHLFCILFQSRWSALPWDTWAACLLS
jgi:hypothetical protein